MHLKRSVYIWNLVLLLVCMFSTLSLAQNPSTPEERTRMTTLAHKLESKPLDDSLRAEREWAIKWLIQVPDIHVKMCTDVLGDFYKSKYKYSSEITTQLMLSSAAYVIEHPDQSNDDLAQYMGGVEGVLKAYNSILKEKPSAKSKGLDDLLQKQSQGTLKDAVQDAAKKCK